MASPVDSMAPDEWERHVKRRMVHLKTKEECRSGNETIQVWTVEMPSRHAEGILKIVKDNVVGQDSVDLQHLRRFAKPKYLPQHVLGKRDYIKEMYAIPRAWESTMHAVMQAPTTTVWEYSVPLKSRSHNRPQTLHLLICPTRMIDAKALRELLMQHPPFCSNADSWAYPLQIKEVTVPLMAPTSPEQAAIWSRDYWPTFYRKTNPLGAHPATIAKAEEELQNPEPGNIGIEEAMTLAHRAGTETKARDYGIGPGCVIIERVDNVTEIIAVAGDARSKPPPSGAVADGQSGGCNGNIMGHAVMRAVGMIGRKRLRVASQPFITRAAKAERNFENCGLDHDEKARDAFFLDLPITPLEEQYFEMDNLKPDGYLCLRLEVILTHEPCMMCSMALVHSRVGRVVFRDRMPQTGGLTAELEGDKDYPVGLGYGLCWRKELNWQFMCWEYVKEKVGRTGTGKVESQKDAPPAQLTTKDDNRVQHRRRRQKKDVMLYDDYANVSSFASVHV